MTMLWLLGFLQPQANLSHRWFYLQTNLMVGANVEKAEALLERASKVGYNGVVVADTKLDFLDDVGEPYLKNAKRFAAKARSLGIEVIPTVASVGWAEGLLHNDPSLVEGQPVRDAVFQVRNGLATLMPDPTAQYRNGGFEEARGDQVLRVAFQDEPGKLTFIDTKIKHSGNQSLRMEPQGGNCRITQSVQVQPYRHYHFSVWVRSENLNGPFEIKALTPSVGQLAEHDIRVAKTQGWTQCHYTFNSGPNKVVNLYMGFWGAKGGAIWLDDAELSEVGLLNVVRRPTCPVTVTNEAGTVLKEGRDYETIVDPKSGTTPWRGGYEVFHEAPPIRVRQGAPVREGERLRVSFTHAVVVSEGKTSVCLNAPGTMPLLAKQFASVERLWSPKGFFIAHDEIRTGGSDDDCLKSGLTPGQTLAKNVADCVSAVKKVHPSAETYVWNDMFDPFHNAVDRYYLVNGSLKGSWEGVPKETIVVNWYFGVRQKNMPFFAERGHRQILAGYYDGDVNSIRRWLDDAKSVKGVIGAMYTTWVGNYGQLEKFAEIAWGGKR